MFKVWYLAALITRIYSIVRGVFIAPQYITFLCTSHQFSLDLFVPVPTLLPGERKAYGPAAITALVTIQTHKQSLSSQVSHSWVERVHMQVRCLAQGHSAKPQQPRPRYTQDL